MAPDRLGGFPCSFDLEFVPFVTGVVVAGVAGMRLDVDLGAPKICEELDALQVLGATQ